jgi:biopolymer transport protein ExbD
MPDEREKLSTAQRMRLRRESVPGGEDDAGGELNVVPFLDIITNVMTFVLATVAVALTTAIPARAPSGRPTGPRPVELPKLALDVVILDDGFAISALGHRIAPGCATEGAGLAVEGGDYAGLTACVEKLKALSPDFAGERQVTIAANGDIRYQTVIDTVDAVRRTRAGEELFPEVYFGVAR